MMLNVLQSYLHRLERLELPYINLDRLVYLARDISWPLGGALIVSGCLACLFGGRRLVFRVLLAPLAAGAAYALVPEFAHLIPMSLKSASYIVALAAGILALISPSLILFLGIGLVGGLVGFRLIGKYGDGSLAFLSSFLPPFALAGALAIVFFRFVSVFISSVFGAAMLMLGVLTIASYTRLHSFVFSIPEIALGVAGCVSVAAMFFQFKFADRGLGRDKAVADMKARAKR